MVKTTPAVVTTIILAILLLPLSAAHAATRTQDAQESQARLTNYTQRSAQLHKRVATLTRKARKAGHRSHLSKRILRTNAVIARMNGSLAGLNEALLACEDVDGRFIDEALACNARATHLDQDTIKLNRRALGSRRVRAVRSISGLRARLLNLSVQLRDKRKPKPTPTPTPTPTQTATATPTPTPTPTSTVPVTQYGANGGDTVDDTTAVKNALTATAGTGTTLYFPAGTYIVAKIIMPANVKLLGAGGSQSWIKGPLELAGGSSVTDVKLGVDGSALRFVSGAVGTTCERVYFAGGGAMSGDGCVISFPSRRGASQLRFLDCTIGANPYDGNGISVTDTGWSGATYHDIEWRGCHFLGSPRMNFECTQRGDGTHAVTLGYHDLDLIDCVFEPSGSEAVSFDGSALCGDSLIDGCLLKGAGWNSAYAWGQGLEINGPTGFTVQNTTIYRTRGSMLNLNGPSGLSGHTFLNNTFDASISMQSVDMNASARIIDATSINGATWKGCTFNAAASAYNNGYLNNCSTNNFTGSTFLGSGDRYKVSLANGASGNIGLP